MSGPTPHPPPGDALFEGHVSVMAALRSGNREVHRVLIARETDTERAAPVERAASAQGVPLERVTRAAIDVQTGGRTHGGIVAIVGPRRFVPLPELIAAGDRPFVVMIDGVEDPYNFGSALRSLYAAGADGLVLRPRNWMSAAGIVARSSAGASELFPAAVAETAEEAANFFQQHGLIVACAAEAAASSIYDTDLSVPLFLLLGGEQRGVTRSLLRRCELRLRIPYARSGVPSLGTAAAAAIIGFEVMRQRAARSG